MNTTDDKHQGEQQPEAPDPETVWGAPTPLWDALVAKLGDPFADRDDETGDNDTDEDGGR